MGKIKIYDSKAENKLLERLNRNISVKDKYTSDEIKVAFSKKDYSLGTEREQQLYIRFFQGCSNEEDLEILFNSYGIKTRSVKSLYKSFSNERKREFGYFWSKRFRLSKIKNEILPRTSIKYKEIDKFKTYELTPCIAYEMAIRNKDVIDIFAKLEKISKMISDDQWLFHRFLSKKEFKDFYNIIDESLLEKEYKKYEFLVMQKSATYTKLIEKDYKFFIDNYIDKCTELGITELVTLKEKLEYELINEYLIYPEGYHRVIPNASQLVTAKITNKQNPIQAIKYDKSKDEIVYEEIIHEEFIERRGLYANSTKFFINNIIPNFKRQVNDQSQMTIPINLSLPLDEIIEYITIVKRKVKTKSPLEILNAEFNKAFDLTNMKTTNTKSKEIALDATKGENPQHKLADMFFIYDMKQNGFTNTDIIYELDKYYKDKKSNMSDNTIRIYLAIAKDYIENERYKELIKGKIVKK